MIKINRRRFVSNAATSAAGLLMGNSLMGFASKEQSLIPGTVIPKESLMKEVMKYRKIDSHAHIHIGAENVRSQIAICRLGAKKVGEQEIAYFGESPKLNYIYSIEKEDWLKRNSAAD